MSRRTHRVLYLGPTYHGSNAESFRRAFVELGHTVDVLDPDEYLGRYATSLPLRVWKKVFRRPLRLHRRELERAVVDAASRCRPTLVFAVKALWIGRETLEAVREKTGAYLLHWHPDDQRNPRSSSPVFLDALRSYDACLTSRDFGVAEYLEDGARRALYVPFAFDPSMHYPVPPRAEERAEACFVGDFEAQRARSLERLAAAGVRLDVWGPNWHKLRKGSPLRRYCRFRFAQADEMNQVFASSDLCLGFLRKQNRDRHTARTFEIPAAGGVMLMERTPDQQAFFEEDVEALYFGDDDELVAKARTYAGNREALARIRDAALDRCRRSRYRYVDRLEDVLRALDL